MTVTDTQGNLHDDSGQFAGRINTPPSPLVPSAMQGSFLFPPPSFETPEQMVEFFETQPISDRVLSNVAHCFRHWRNGQILAAVTDQYNAWAGSPKVQRSAERDPGAFEAQAVAYLDQLRAAEEQRWQLQEIAMTDIRSAVIAYRIDSYRNAVLTYDTADGPEQVRQHPLPVFGGYNTVAELVDGYSMHDWADRAFTEADLTVKDATQAGGVLHEGSIIKKWVIAES